MRREVDKIQLGTKQ